jgi:hypothetical protein
LIEVLNLGYLKIGDYLVVLGFEVALTAKVLGQAGFQDLLAVLTD